MKYIYRIINLNIFNSDLHIFLYMPLYKSKKFFGDTIVLIHFSEPYIIQALDIINQHGYLPEISSDPTF
jgi:hypothetical protein